MQMTINPDKGFVEKIKAQMKANNGFCEYSISQKNPDGLCLCKKFREKLEKREPGPCDCGLYIITIDDEIKK